MRRPPGSTRIDTRFPYPTLFRARVAVARLEFRRQRPRRLAEGQAEQRKAEQHERRLARLAGAQQLRREAAERRDRRRGDAQRSEEHTSELQSLMRISYADFCLKKKNNLQKPTQDTRQPEHP